MRFHLVSLPHTQTTKANSACAYTEKVRKFAGMMSGLGHEVFLYASEQNEATVTELIPCISQNQQADFGFSGPADYLKLDFNPDLLIWQVFNRNVIEALKSRLQPQDFICLITSYPAQPIAEAYPNHQSVEIGIGYKATFSQYRVFESHAWRNFIAGKYDEDGHFFDEVIPNYFELDDFPLQEQKDDYYLYIGRLTPKKGWRVAQDVCQRLNKRLIVAGQGDFDGYGEYVGMVGPEQRAELMGGAVAVFVPTTYIPPFEGVHVEAMLCGTPVITTDFGVFSETVINGVNGYRCSTFAEFLAAAELVKSLSPVAIRERAAGLYATDVVAGLYQRYFQRLLSLWGDGFYAINNNERTDNATQNQPTPEAHNN